LVKAPAQGCSEALGLNEIPRFARFERLEAATSAKSNTMF
jgi:hypothetical protein